MGQADVLRLLEKNPGKKFTAVEIAEKLEINVRAAQRALKVLYKNSEIATEEISKRGSWPGGRPLLLYVYKQNEGSP